MATPFEVDASKIAFQAEKDGKNIYFPRTLEDFSLEFASGDLKKGKLGILEPVGEKYEGDFDIIIIPGVCYDNDFNRLGMGKGCYDRFLKETKAFKIFPAFKVQGTDKIETDKFDIKVDMIVNEEEILRR